MNNNLGAICHVPRDISYRLRKARKHKDFDDTFIKKLHSQDPELVLSEATPEARKLYNLAKEVSTDTHRVKMYTRLQVSKKGILFATIDPEHEVEFDALDFFIHRFPTYMIMLESKRGLFYGSSSRPKTFTKNSIKELLPVFETYHEKDDILEELEDFSDDLWQKFYSGQNVRTRRNTKLFYKNMPKKSQKAYDMDIENSTWNNNKTLKEFF